MDVPRAGLRGALAGYTLGLGFTVQKNRFAVGQLLLYRSTSPSACCQVMVLGDHTHGVRLVAAQRLVSLLLAAGVGKFVVHSVASLMGWNRLTDWLCFQI